MADAGEGIRHIPGRSLPVGHFRHNPRPFLIALTALLTLFAGCTPILQGPPPGSAGQVALSAAISALDPNNQGSEAWQRQNGPNAWMYKVNVGKDTGQNRLLMYYVLENYDGVNSPPLGTHSDTAFMAKAKQITDSYQQADSSHPVVNSIDLVDPIPDPFPGPDRLYRHYRPQSDIDQYLKVARDNHMLFFFDTNVGQGTQQQAVSTFMPYLEQPDVNLAIDPEWEMRPGDVPGQVRGRTTAATINWVIDQLSTLVTTRHLPPKILVVHIFRRDEQYDNPNRPDPRQSWDKIQLKPGVTLIISLDGQGSISNKVGNYNILVNGDNGYQFFADQKTSLGTTYLMGFKVYIQIPCDGNHPNCEDPIMTPHQVLALNPSPVMVQYQ
jgi:hypothetical protein